MPKKKKETWMPKYSASELEKKADEYCIRNNIRISPHGIYGNANEWRIGISSGANYRDIKVDPNTYGPDEIWQKVFEYKIFYYDKRSKEEEGHSGL